MTLFYIPHSPSIVCRRRSCRAQHDLTHFGARTESGSNSQNDTLAVWRTIYFVYLLDSHRVNCLELISLVCYTLDTCHTIVSHFVFCWARYCSFFLNTMADVGRLTGIFIDFAHSLFFIVFFNGANDKLFPSFQCTARRFSHRRKWMRNFTVYNMQT